MKIGFKNTMLFFNKQVKSNNFQFGKFQHQLFGSGSVKMHGGFFIGSSAVHGEDGARAEFLVHDAHAFLQKVGIGGLERLSCGVNGGLLCGTWRVCGANFFEAMFLGVRNGGATS